VRLLSPLRRRLNRHKKEIICGWEGCGGRR